MPKTLRKFPSLPPKRSSLIDSRLEDLVLYEHALQQSVKGLRNKSIFYFSQLRLGKALASMKGHQPLGCNPTVFCHQMPFQSSHTAPTYQAPPRITGISSKEAGGKESANTSRICGPEGLWESPGKAVGPVGPT